MLLRPPWLRKALVLAWPRWEERWGYSVRMCAMLTCILEVVLIVVRCFDRHLFCRVGPVHTISSIEGGALRARAGGRVCEGVCDDVWLHIWVDAVVNVRYLGLKVWCVVKVTSEIWKTHDLQQNLWSNRVAWQRTIIYRHCNKTSLSSEWRMYFGPQ